MYVCVCVFLGVTTLSSFTKNLLLQTLLEDDKIRVTVTSYGLNYTFSSLNSLTPDHLSSGVGHSSKTVLISIYDSMEKLSDILSKGTTYHPTSNTRIKPLQLQCEHRSYRLNTNPTAIITNHIPKSQPHCRNVIDNNVVIVIAVMVMI